jgi:hypothetical protein
MLFKVIRIGSLVATYTLTRALHIGTISVGYVATYTLTTALHIGTSSVGYVATYNLTTALHIFRLLFVYRSTFSCVLLHLSLLYDWTSSDGRRRSVGQSAK